MRISSQFFVLLFFTCFNGHWLSAEAQSVATAIDLDGTIVTDGGNLPWFWEDRPSSDGIDSARSGDIDDNQSSSFSIDAFGPGTVSFYWKVSSEPDNDFLRFYIDGEEQPGSISGVVDWELKSFTLEPGLHVLTWSYTKNGFDDRNSDTAWVDQIRFPGYNKVSFDLGMLGTRGGGGALAQYIPNGGSAVAPIVFAASGWVHTGWDRSFDSVASDLTVTAEYSVSPGYTVTFDPGPHGSLLNGDLVQSVGEGYTAIAPDLRTVDGWSFVGWDKNYSNVKEDLIVTAQYVPESLSGISENLILASDRKSGDNFGISVDVSGDTAVIGAHGDGSVYVFLRSGNMWIEKAKLMPSDGNYQDRFGVSVSISGDTVVVGDDGDDDQGVDSGSAYIFFRNGGTWTEQAKLTASDGEAFDYFGGSVSVSGNRVVIGANEDNDKGSHSGSAYVFVRNGSKWAEEAKLTASDGGEGDEFGISVGLSGDTAIIGADSGSAYAFIRDTGEWTEEAKLAIEETNGEGFHFSVAISGDTAVIGDRVSESAFVYVRDENGWIEQAKLVPGDGGRNGFGTDVSVSGDVVVIGAFRSGVNGSNRAYVYMRKGGIWEEHAMSEPSFGLGQVVSVSGDSAVFGYNSHDGIGRNSGIAFIYDLGVPPATVTFDLGEHGVRTGGGELSQLVKLGNGAIAPAVRATPGLGLAGWDKDFSSVTGDMVVTAIYALGYNVTFDLDGKGIRTGGGELIQSIVAGAAATEPEIQAHTGWLFTGWDLDFSFVSSDRTVRAQYVPVTPVYSVTFDLGLYGTLLGGSLNQNVNEGSTAIAPELSVNDGWVFVGWDKSYHDVKDDLIVTAQFVPESLAAILEFKVLPGDGENEDDFGISVSMSGDTALVGAYGDDENGSNSGSAYVFVRDGSTWYEQAKLLPGDGAENDNFGRSVCLSGDTALIGANGDDDEGNEDSGSAYVFLRNGNTWVEQAKLTAGDGAARDHFGYSVSVSGDTAVVGAFLDDDRGLESGSAYVFVRNGGVWTEGTKLTASDGSSSDRFGISVGLSGDTILVGAFLDDAMGIASGSAYVFVRNENSWTEQAKLTAEDGSASSGFGWSVSLSGDTAVIGAYGDSENGSAAGSAYVFVRNESTWVEQAKLIASDGAEHDGFGQSVSLSGDTILIGSYGDSSGSAYLFVRDGDSWKEDSKLTASDGAEFDFFGASVSLDGGAAVIGAYGDVDLGVSSGSSYFFDIGAPPVIVTFDLGLYGMRSGGGELFQSITAGSAAIAPSISVTSGWGFAGWDVDFESVREDLTVTALYAPIYEVKFELGVEGIHLGGGGLIQSVTGGLGAVEPIVEGNTGWVFAGWDLDFSFISSDQTVTAQYLPIFSVSFDPGLHGTLLNGSLLQSIVKGATAIAPELSIENGWTFIGWDKSYTNVIGDITVTAQYVPESLAGILEKKVFSNDGTAGDRFGHSVSINGDTAVIGAYRDDDNGMDSGSAYVFVRDGSEWIEQAKLVASDGAATDHFGYSVGLSGDTILIGATMDDDQGIDSGSVYVFIRNGVKWLEQAKLMPGDGSDFDYFGNSVSVSGDIVVVGAYGDDDRGDQAGGVYVFLRDGNNWIEHAKLLSEGGAAMDHFGTSVSVSGGIIVVGAPGVDEQAIDSGRAYAFVRNGSEWDEQAVFEASDLVADQFFGQSVSVSGDTIVIGAYGDDEHGNNSGSAYVFDWDGNNWIEQTKLVAGDGAEGNNFGISVSLSGDTLVVGAKMDDSEGENSGSAYVFVRDDNTWKEKMKLLASDGGVSDSFGNTVRIHGDVALIGTSQDNDEEGNLSGAYFYDLGVPLVEVTFDLGDHGTRIGGGELTQLVVAGSTVIPPTVVVTPGLGFVTWDTDFSVVSSDLTITAIYAPQYTVNFDLVGIGTRTGGGELTQFVLEGSAAIAPEIDGIAGWFFTGWDIDFSFVSSDLIVTAQYSPVYTVTFDLGLYGTLLGGSLVQDVVEGAAAIAPDISVAEDWAFVGWDNSFNNVNKNLEILAQYVPKSLAGIVEEKIFGSNGELDDYFGSSVSVSGDTAVIGAYGKDDLGSESGCAYIFVRDDGKWTEQAKLLASDGAEGDNFARSVSISGNTVVVGASEDDDQGNDSGSAYVFVRNGSSWTEQVKLKASDGSTSDRFGYSVSISEDTAVIGAYLGDDNGYNSGSAYVFVRSGGDWIEQAKLTASDGAEEDSFGYSVSVSRNTAVIGAYLDDDNGSDSGSAYVFVRIANEWIEQAKLLGSDGEPGDDFGLSVSVSGNTAVVGAFQDDDIARDSGSAYIFVRNGNTWFEQAKLTVPDGATGDNFGNSVAISGDTVVIGAYRDDNDGLRSSGSAYLFVRSEGRWAQRTKLTASDGAGFDYFGLSVGVSGNTAVIGALRNEANGSFSGSAYCYDLDAPPLTVTFDLGDRGTRTGGGELSQLVKIGGSAIAPVVEASSGWRFSVWDSDFSNVTTDLTVMAVYINLNDLDGDIMEDAWEIIYFGSSDARNGLGDWDKDGRLDFEEFITGEDPTDPARYFHIMNQSLSDGHQDVTLTFTSSDDRENRRYRIYYTDDIQNPVWIESSLGPIVPDAGDHTTRSFALPGGSQNVFFKVEGYLK